MTPRAASVPDMPLGCCRWRMDCSARPAWSGPPSTRIAVGVGPGTFTGLRIGVATARGLAQSLGAELVGVSSLLALSHAAHIDRSDDTVGVLAVIDARRNEVFVAAYDGDIQVVESRALAPADMNGLLELAEANTNVEQWMGVGDGATRYRDALERIGVVVPEEDSSLHRIDARSLCGLGERASSGDMNTGRA